MIRIPIKNGDIDAALDKFKTVKKEQDKAFNERLTNILSPSKDQQQQKPKQQKPQQPTGQQHPPAPSYQSLLARSRRIG